MFSLMKRHGFMLAALFAVIVMVAAGAQRFLFAPETGAIGRGQQANPVIAHTVGEVEFIRAVEAIGTARANESVEISAKVTDIVSKLRFDSGDFVKKGDILVELASVEQGADLREANAALADAERELARLTDLVQRGVTPRVRQDEAQTVRDRARERVSAVQSRLSDRVIRAPFSGYIGLRLTSPGQLARPGETIVSLDDVSVIKLDLDVPERDLSRVSKGQSITATAAAFPGTVFVGKITEIDSRIDSVTRSVRVRAEINNKDNQLRPGMLMQASVRQDSRLVVAVPEIALLRRDDTAFVYVVAQAEGGLTAQTRNVEPGERRQGMIEIISGLRTGEQVIVEGIVRLRPNAPIRFADEKPQRPVTAAAGQAPATGARGG
jgi:membrane fusion protein (multidrug efflux system)